MANVPSAEKRNRQRIKRRVRNLSHLVPMRTHVKRAKVALESGKDAPEANESLVLAALRQIARAAQKGVIHKRTAARKISRLTLAANKAKSALVVAREAAKTAPTSAAKASAKKPASRKTAPASKK